MCEMNSYNYLEKTQHFVGINNVSINMDGLGLTHMDLLGPLLGNNFSFTPNQFPTLRSSKSKVT